jgi:hypothetical protein
MRVLASCSPTWRCSMRFLHPSAPGGRSRGSARRGLHRSDPSGRPRGSVRHEMHREGPGGRPRGRTRCAFCTERAWLKRRFQASIAVVMSRLATFGSQTQHTGALGTSNRCQTERNSQICRAGTLASSQKLLNVTTKAYASENRSARCCSWNAQRPCSLLTT